MAGHFELHSFLSKFCNLWSSGRNARLAVECQAGQATVNLQLDLGLPHHEHPQEDHQKRVSPSRLRRSARRAKARHQAAVDAAEATATDKPSNTNTAAAKAAPSVKDASEEDAAPTKEEAAVQAAPQVMEAAVQAAPLTVDVAVQAEVPRHLLHQPPPHLQAAAQALQLAPHTVQDLFCPDRDFWVASRAEHERDRRENEHQQKEDKKKDLENFQKMLDRSFSSNI
jgi:hypothetical protein